MLAMLAAKPPLNITVAASTGDTPQGRDSDNRPTSQTSAPAPTVDLPLRPSSPEENAAASDGTAAAEALESTPSGCANGKSDELACQFLDCKVCAFLRLYEGDSERPSGQSSPRLPGSFLEVIRHSIKAAETVFSESEINLDKVRRSRKAQKKIKSMRTLASDITKELRAFRQEYNKIQKEENQGVPSTTSSTDYDPLIDWWAVLENDFIGLYNNFKARKYSLKTWKNFFRTWGRFRLVIEKDQKMLNYVQEQCDHYRKKLSAFRSPDGAQAESNGA